MSRAIIIRPVRGQLSRRINRVNGCLFPKRQFHSISDDRHTWSILKHIYQKQLKVANKKFACLLLNMTDESQSSFDRHKNIWDDADIKIAVDGSANFLAKRKLLQTADVISGDFDSIDGKLIERLQSPRKAHRSLLVQTTRGNQTSESPVRTPQVVETPSQRETDFTKAIHVASGIKPDLHAFLGLYFADGHRMDHLFGLINTLHLIKKDIFILNIKSNTISWLLSPGSHTIVKPHGQELCSLVPFSGPTGVKTQGLLYNLNKSSPMSFGGLISTSNLCQPGRDRILIDTERDVLWSIDLYRDLT